MDYMKIVKDAKEVSQNNYVSFSKRKSALVSISEALIKYEDEILKANKLDLDSALNLSPAFIKRLTLTKDLIRQISNSVKNLTKLDDVVYKTLSSNIMDNNMVIDKVSVPFGVILAIFESRPNVCVDIACLCIMTGNVCILKGGKESINTNICLVNIIKEAIKDYIECKNVNLITDNNKEVVDKLIQLDNYIDLVVPRGGRSLINYICNNSKVPYIETGAGVCHIYIDEFCDLDMALDIINNAKLSNPSVCNSCECLLIHEKISEKLLNKLKDDNFFSKVKAFGCEKCRNIIKCNKVEDYAIEFNDLMINIKIVNSINEALSHIKKYSTKHSEVIITDDINCANYFLTNVDAACVYHNVSSRFSDGGCFGFGCELGIATSKMHARGPMGLKEMTTYKYIIRGNGQVR